MPSDPFARATAANAHQRATAAEKHALEAKKIASTRPGRHQCVLCGMQAVKGSDYCKGHAWAA